MRIAAAFLVFCFLAADVQSRSVIVADGVHQRDARNLLLDAVKGVQNVLGQAVGGALNAGGALAHTVISTAEGAVVAGVNAVEKMAETLVQHNAFAVRILQCLAGAASRKTESVADAAESAVDAVSDAVAGALQLDGNKATRNLVVEAGGAVRECVLGALQESVGQLQEAAHSVVGNAGSVAADALAALHSAIDSNIQANSTLLQSLDDAVNVAQQVMQNITQSANDAVDDAADKAKDVLDDASDGSSARRRNVFWDVSNNVKDALAQSLGKWIGNSVGTLEENAENWLTQVENAAEEAIQKAQEAVDNNFVTGSDWEQALNNLLQNAEQAKNEITSTVENAVDSAVEKGQEIAASLESSGSNSTVDVDSSSSTPVAA